jgi:group I intron endonuclease
MKRNIYAIRNLINGKVYIGQTSNIGRRWRTHLHRAKSGLCRPLYSAIRKYGKESFSIEVLLECDESVVDEKEIEYIRLFESCSPDRGYNLAGGGSATFKHSDESKRKISESKKGYKPSPESIDKRKETLKARKDEEISELEKAAKSSFASYWKGKKRPKREMTEAERQQRRNASAKANAKRWKKTDTVETQP